MPIGRSTTARLLRPFPPTYRARKNGTTVRITAGPEASADRSGTVADSTTITGTVAGSKAAPDTVAATITASATVAGRKAAPDAATGTITATGTVAGREGHAGAVTGSLTVTGTTSGAKAVNGLVAATITSAGIISGAEHHFGQVVAEITSTATVVGSKDEPQPPEPRPPAPSGGGGVYIDWAPRHPKRKPPMRDARRGSVHGTVASAGTATGSRRSLAVIHVRTPMRTHAHGVKATRAATCTYTRLMPRIRRDLTTDMPMTLNRRQVDEDELLLMTP